MELTSQGQPLGQLAPAGQPPSPPPVPLKTRRVGDPDVLSRCPETLVGYHIAGILS